MRAPFVVLVIPYRRLPDGDFEYALMLRSDNGVWQPVSGGGEDDETPLETARRETFEETGIRADSTLLQLDTVNSIAVTHFSESHIWGDEVYVIPMYCFGVRFRSDVEIRLSHEHEDVRWLRYPDAMELAHYEDNRLALWELNRRVRGLGPRNWPISKEGDER